MTQNAFLNHCLFLLFAFPLASCHREAPPISLADDKIYADYLSEISAFEKRKDVLVKQRAAIEDKKSSMLISSKVSEILGKQGQTINESLVYLDQTINYLKIKSLSRKKFVLDNHRILTKNDLDTQHKDYLLDKQANPIKKPWESGKLSPVIKDDPAPKKETGGH